jgi:hypothetical protein
MANNLGRGCTTIDEDNVVGPDQGGGQRANVTLLIRKRESPLLISRFQLHSLAEDRAAVSPFQDALLLKPLEVTSDRRLRGIQERAQIGRARDLVRRQEFLDAVAPLRWDERFGHQTVGCYVVVEGN